MYYCNSTRHYPRFSVYGSACYGINVFDGRLLCLVDVCGVHVVLAVAAAAVGARAAGQPSHRNTAVLPSAATLLHTQSRRSVTSVSHVAQSCRSVTSLSHVVHLRHPVTLLNHIAESHRSVTSVSHIVVTSPICTSHRASDIVAQSTKEHTRLCVRKSVPTRVTYEH